MHVDIDMLSVYTVHVYFYIHLYMKIGLFNRSLVRYACRYRYVECIHYTCVFLHTFVYENRSFE